MVYFLGFSLMKIKKRNEVLDDIIHHGKKHPSGWMAAFGKNNHDLSDDYFLHHPKIGLFYIKEYQKNPYQHIGIGGKVARKIDEEVTEELHKQSHHFGIIQGDVRKITENIKKGITPEEIVQGMINGKDKGMSMPVKGTASQSSKQVDKIKDHGKIQQKKIDQRFRQIAKAEGLYSAYE